MHPSSDDARKKHNTPIASFINQSINQSLARSSFANLFVIRRVRKIARHRRHRVGRRKRPTHRESSSITSRHRTTNQRINESHRAHHPSPIASHRIAPRNDVHHTRAIARASNGVGKPSNRSNARGRRVHAHDPRARRHVDDALFFFFFLSFFRPLSVDAVSRDGCLPSSRVVDSSLSDATTRRMNECMHACMHA